MEARREGPLMLHVTLMAMRRHLHQKVTARVISHRHHLRQSVSALSALEDHAEALSRRSEAIRRRGLSRMAPLLRKWSSWSSLRRYRRYSWGEALHHIWRAEALGYFEHGVSTWKLHHKLHHRRSRSGDRRDSRQGSAGRRPARYVDLGMLAIGPSLRHASRDLPLEVIP